MWTELIKNIDTKQDSKDLWREINKMRVLDRKKRGGNMRNKNGRIISTESEKAEAFKSKIQRTFQISEQDSENYDDWMGEMLEA